MGSRTYYREQKHICGDSYDTAGYMEVDLYPVSSSQHAASRRKKQKEATSLAQQTYNDNRAKRYCVQLMNTNFKENDYSWTGTFDDEHLPDPEDTKRVDNEWSKYIGRVYYWCDKHGIKRPKWIMVAEYCTEQESGGTLGRHHMHAVIEHTDGLDRDILEELWKDKDGKPLGFTRCERLQADHGSFEALARYICKNRRCERRWRQSRGLKKPLTPQPNDSRWTKKKLHDASTLYVDDAAFWEKMYPGYTLNRVETSVSDAGQRHTLVIMRRLDAYHYIRRKRD